MTTAMSLLTFATSFSTFRCERKPHKATARTNASGILHE
jgi:hypothetical protein